MNNSIVGFLLALLGAVLGLVLISLALRFLTPQTCEQRGGVVLKENCHAALQCHGIKGRLGFSCHMAEECEERCVSSTSKP